MHPQVTNAWLGYHYPSCAYTLVRDIVESPIPPRWVAIVERNPARCFRHEVPHRCAPQGRPASHSEPARLPRSGSAVPWPAPRLPARATRSVAVRASAQRPAEGRWVSLTSLSQRDSAPPGWPRACPARAARSAAVRASAQCPAEGHRVRHKSSRCHVVTARGREIVDAI